ncbi:MAG: MBL fold metallo-hydrolase [Candidatus Puniceispirillales bacterium]
MKITIHGSRGSIPSPSRDTIAYGGNTSCLELQFDGYQVFLDTGSGFKDTSLSDGKINKLIFFSHWHHDHIQGLPFNSHIFNQDHHIRLSSALGNRHHLREMLHTTFSGRYFSIDIVNTLPNLICEDISAVKKSVEKDFQLDWIELQHPGGCYGYRIKNDGKTFCYLTDNEYNQTQFPALADFTSGADLVVWDGMYTQDELRTKAGWGHSSIEQGITFFNEADIKSMIITHHAPFRTDDMLDQMQSMLPEGIDFARDQMRIII